MTMRLWPLKLEPLRHIEVPEVLFNEFADPPSATLASVAVSISHAKEHGLGCAVAANAACNNIVDDGPACEAGAVRLPVTVVHGIARLPVSLSTSAAPKVSTQQLKGERCTLLNVHQLDDGSIALRELTHNGKPVTRATGE